MAWSPCPNISHQITSISKNMSTGYVKNKLIKKESCTTVSDIHVYGKEKVNWLKTNYEAPNCVIVSTSFFIHPFSSVLCVISQVNHKFQHPTPHKILITVFLPLNSLWPDGSSWCVWATVLINSCITTRSWNPASLGLTSRW